MHVSHFTQCRHMMLIALCSLSLLMWRTIQGGMNKYTKKREPTVKGIPWLPELLLDASLGVSVPPCLPFIPSLQGFSKTLG